MSDEFQCLKCKSNISSLVGYHTLTDEFIECPSCKHKMEVKYDESYDEDGGEYGWFWVEELINE